MCTNGEVTSYQVATKEGLSLRGLYNGKMGYAFTEAYDDEAIAMLVNGVLEKLPDKFLVAASGMAGLGSANSIKTRRVMERFYLCGDGVSDVGDDIGLVAPRVMLCAAHQAQMVLRILSGEYEP